jgi:signal transduction histidine kinase
VWESLSFGNGFSSVKIILDFPKDQTIMIDKTRLKILLNNIFSNAIKYQDFDKPSDERFFKVSFEQSNDQYKFSFEDNGIGIPENQLPQIGTMFHRASYQSEGSGLGLFIAKQAIEKMNGQINFRSVLGKGTVILIAIKKD